MHAAPRLVSATRRHQGSASAAVGEIAFVEETTKNTAGTNDGEKKGEGIGGEGEKVQFHRGGQKE